MFIGNVGILAALLAGILLFFTPCVLPLIPVYLGYISGISLGRTAPESRFFLLTNALLFVFGFSAVFVLLGASIGFIGFAVAGRIEFLEKLFGGALILMGLLMIGVIKIPFLMRAFQFSPAFGEKTTYLRSFLVGVSFAFVWNPCVGPLLGAILTLAYDSKTVLRGTILLIVFSAGFGIPFLLSAVFIDRLRFFTKKIRGWIRLSELAGGALLISLGILVLFGALTKLNNLLPFSNFTWS